MLKKIFTKNLNGRYIFKLLFEPLNSFGCNVYHRDICKSLLCEPGCFISIPATGDKDRCMFIEVCRHIFCDGRSCRANIPARLTLFPAGIPVGLIQRHITLCDATNRFIFIYHEVNFRFSSLVVRNKNLFGFDF